VAARPAVMTPKHDIELRTLPAMLRHNAEREPDREFVRDEAGALTRADVHLAARRIAAGWHRLGVEKGERVALMLENSRELLLSWFGLATLGAVEVPVNTEYIGARLVHVLNHSRARTLVVRAEHLEQVDAVAGELSSLERVIVVGDHGATPVRSMPWEELLAAAPLAREPSVRLSDAVAVMYTSGSTGPAKGVILCHGQHYVNGHQAASVLELTSDDRIYLCLPLHHNMAQGYGVWPAIVSGAVLELSRRFDRRSFWADVGASGATVFPFVGAMLLLLAKLPPSAAERAHSLRAGYGVPIPRDLHEPLEERYGLRLVHGYGSTEATIVAWSRGEGWVPGSAGPPLEDFEVRIVDDEDIPLPVGERGEICIRSRQPHSMFMEYLHEPEKTVRAWRNLWYHSGDRGWIDDRGNLWFADRRGDVIRRMGEFVDSFEVEEAALAHPDVANAAAYGVPSEVTEEEVMVAVVPREGDLDAEAVHAWCAARLPRFAVPRFVAVLPELPMTATGKVEKYRLKEVGVTPQTFDARNGARR
jgi:carnitine-CoA ligase